MVLQTTSRVQEFINTASVITKYKRLLTKVKCIKVKRVLTRVCSTCHGSRVTCDVVQQTGYICGARCTKR